MLVITLAQSSSFFINIDKHELISFVPVVASVRNKVAVKALPPHGSFHFCISHSMSAIILLIRHVEHVEFGKILSGRRRDVALSRRGIEQAAILADLLGTQEIRAVYSSPRERAWYTAREIAEPHALKVLSDGRLDEVDFGRWSGCSFAELEGDAAWSDWNEHRGSARPPDGESMAEAVGRAFSLLEEAAAEHDGGAIVAVSHCDVLRGVIARCLGLAFDNLLRFDIDPASISRIALGAWGSRVMSINERPFQ